ncbi:AAA family ATPase [Aeromicrobium sp.]|uniref:uridine kinase family protein n=1 Tax=Aeromicrobium sp. TaxID=1871063 RepID=UPI0025C57471|nr:AAA family ATPase [Aeromicrobium sp.]
MDIVPLATLWTEICSRPPVDGVRLVGIDGAGGSGKSTLARRLAAIGGAPIIKVDDFVSWGDLETWWPRWEDEVLRPLSRGLAARHGVRDWAGDDLGSSVRGARTTPWAPVVLLEGVTCTRAAATERLAHRIWVQAPTERRLERSIARDGESHRDLCLQWMDMENEFFARDGTRDRADLIVDGAPQVEHDRQTSVVTVRPRPTV